MIRAALWAACAAVLAGCASFGQRPNRTAPAPQGPIALYTDCVNALVVGLRWDPAGRQVTRYTITRNGSTLGTTTETNFADTTVAASTTYSYSVSAVLASGETTAGSTAEVNTPAASPSGDPPYCKSSHIDSMSWDWAGGHTEPNGSDLWPVTWGKDGKVYTFFGDGGGFGGDNYRGRVSFGVAMITAGPPLSPTAVENVYGGYQGTHPSSIDGKAGSIIAVGKDFYTLGGLYNEAELAGVKGHRSGAPERTQLAYSKGNAYSWRAASWIFCSARTARGAFCPIGFVNYGPGNAGAPDDYVYLLGFANSAQHWEGDDGGPEVAAERLRSPPPQDAAAEQPATAAEHDTAEPATGAATYLARVSKRHVLQREAYRYFAGLDSRGRPIWSPDQRQMRAIFTDRNGSRPGCGGQCEMASPLEEAVYNPVIRRYIAVGHGGAIGQTSFYDAPQLWGPWTTISYNNFDPATGTGGWANLGTAGGGSLGVHPINAWTSADGLTLWMTYSSDGKAPPGALFPPEGTMMDSFNLVSVRLISLTTQGGPHASR
jgi:hypothetical protein